MRTIETKVYLFDELNDKAKARAIEEHRDWNVGDIEWWDFSYDHHKDRLKEFGYQVKDIKFSGFWSQGDGACFSGHVNKDHNQCLALLPCDLATRVREFNAKCRLFGAPEIELSFASRITTNGRYSHSGTMSLDCPTFVWGDHDTDEYDIPTQAEFAELTQVLHDCAEIDKAVIEEAREYADEIYSELEEEYEFLTSDEQVAEMIRANGYEFDEDGDRI
jgi:hypothetical protein